MYQNDKMDTKGQILQNSEVSAKIEDSCYNNAGYQMFQISLPQISWAVG